MYIVSWLVVLEGIFLVLLLMFVRMIVLPLFLSYSFLIKFLVIKKKKKMCTILYECVQHCILFENVFNVINIYLVYNINPK